MLGSWRLQSCPVAKFIPDMRRLPMKMRNNTTLGVASVQNGPTINVLRVALTILFTMIALPSIFGQGLGSISGSINDPTGAMVPSVTVTATRVDEGTTSTVTANDLGFYVF